MKKALLGWFSPERRVALYAVALVVLPALARFGLIQESAVEPWLIVVQLGLQVLAGVLMLTNLSFQDAATWFARGGRAAIYSAGAFLAPALTALGLLTSEQAEQWLQGLADILSIAAALVAALYISPTKTPQQGV